MISLFPSRIDRALNPCIPGASPHQPQMRFIVNSSRAVNESPMENLSPTNNDGSPRKRSLLFVASQKAGSMKKSEDASSGASGCSFVDEPLRHRITTEDTVYPLFQSLWPRLDVLTLIYRGVEKTLFRHQTKAADEILPQ